MARQFLPEGMELEVVAPDVDASDLAAAMKRADVMMGFVERPLPPSVIEAMASLKLVQLLSAGYDKVDIEAMRRLRLPVATNGGANAVAVAEHAIMLMLAVYRKLVELNAKVRRDEWRTGSLGTGGLYEIAGKTVGLIGLGMIGREVAKRLRAFEANVIYHDIARLAPEAERELGVSYCDFDQLIAAADIVSLHTPLTPQTRHMIGKQQLERMKPSAILINTARGALVDNEALADAIRGGVIAGAGLDTTDPEPPPPGFPLLTMPNVTVTPHTAGPTVDSWPKRLRNAYANIARVAAGEKPLWVIPELRDL